MEFKIGKLYKIKQQLIFCPENYYKFDDLFPTFTLKKDAILLFFKIREAPTTHVKELLYNAKEHVFLFESKLIVPYNPSTDRRPENYFERVL